MFPDLKLARAICAALLLPLGLWLVGGPAAHAQLGHEVVNTAEISYRGLAGSFTISSNEAAFVIEAQRTPSTITLFRVAPGAPDAVTVRLNGTGFSPSGAVSGPFDDATPKGFGFGEEVGIVETDHILPGELLVVGVTDAGQNGNPGEIETVTVTVTDESGDAITLRLFESGPDTGVFFAFLQTSAGPSHADDQILTTPSGTSLEARYVDAFDATEVSIDTALVDPFGRLFDSLTGALVDGATVTIIDAATGQPADVFGLDGVSVYPSTLQTGGTVIDASGRLYDLGAGEFLFPLVRPGTYSLLVLPPAGYVFPSLLEETDFAGLANGPFTIIGGSYGGTFLVEATGPLNFDVPLDGAGELVVLKEASVQVLAVGDFVEYAIRIENRDAVAAPLILEDVLPEGFRYEAGSTRHNGQPADDPAISADGRTLTYRPGFLSSGDTAELRYVALATAGAGLGEAVNSATAINSAGAPLSNRAEAAVIVREDLLRSRFTLVGRVAADACNPDEDWAREIGNGEGVAGVRLYLETGDYVVTDEDGLYHFENIRPGTHVVQVDRGTLPNGYEPVICEENTRFAGSAVSQFVDAVGGSIWRANFYLRRTAVPEAESEPVTEVPVANEDLFGQAWLETADTDIAWVYPDTSLTPASQSLNLGIKHPDDHRVRLVLNGQPVPPLNFSGLDTATTGHAAISRWRGIDIAPGLNTVLATVLDAEGQVRETLTRDIWFVSKIERAALVDDQSELAADGRTLPSIALRITDAAGRPVHAGRQVEVDVAAPYALAVTEILERDSAVRTELSAVTTVSVGPDGIAHVELAPTLQTGRVRLLVRLDTGRQQEIDVFLRPEKRDWILVGLADGALGLDQIDGPGTRSADDLLSDGRLAFFAKGVVRGDWLLTLAVDTARKRGRDGADGDLFEGDIDPNAFYTLYGDRTFQDREAESRYPLFVKLERDTFQVLFGDFDTDLEDTRLSRYSRRLSGLKSVYETDSVSVSAFAAETNQGFVREELAADGTSGPYRLAGAPLLRNSEAIFVETRDRFRPDEVRNVLTLARYVDYEIDFDTGELFFRRPVSAVDNGFHPNVIIVEYETSAATDRNVTAGGRAAARAFDGRLEAGATYVREEGDPASPESLSQLAGVDLTVSLAETTELRAEYARTVRDNAPEDAPGKDTADAFLAELVHTHEAVTATAYYREQEDGFGLGQQSSGTGGVRRVGAAATAEIGRAEAEADIAGTRHFIDSEVYHEEVLRTGARRTVADAAVRREGGLFGASLGLRNVFERPDAAGDETRQSFLLTSALRKTFADAGLTLTAAHEQPLGGGSDESSVFPQRTILGADKTLTSRATLNIRHEILDGANASGNNTTVGATVTPWTGADVRLSTDYITQDSARRLSATVGVDQTIQLSETWSTGFGFARRARISGSGEPLDLTPDAAFSPLETAPASPLTLDQSFSSAHAGLGYRSEVTAASARLEVRDSALGTRYAGILGGAREASETLSFALAARIERDLAETAADTTRIDARLGASWRPRGEGAVIFNRFDVGHQEISGVTTQWKLVNNLGLNTRLGDRTQLAVFHGIRYAEATFGDLTFDSVTNLVGGEVRHDVTERFDIGLSGSVLVSDSGEADFQYGPSVGVTPAKNVWLSVGWNIKGFRDNDFEAAEFSRDGPFVKLRIKFDQDTAAGLLRRITPGANGAE